MISNIFRTFCVFAVLLLMVMGLNTSNQGINQLSQEFRGPVVALTWQDHNLHWDWLGKGHNYPTKPIEEKVSLYSRWVQKALREFNNY